MEARTYKLPTPTYKWNPSSNTSDSQSRIRNNVIGCLTEAQADTLKDKCYVTKQITETFLSQACYVLETMDIHS